MVTNNVTKQVGSGKPLSQFKAPKRPEIMRLPPIDDTEMGTITTVKALGKGSGKDGRPLVADLIRLREKESKLVQELANKTARVQAQLLAALVAQEAEFTKRLERMDSLTKANVLPTKTLSLT